MSYNGMGIIIIGGKQASPWSSGVFAPMIAAQPLGDAAAPQPGAFLATSEDCLAAGAETGGATWSQVSPAGAPPPAVGLCALQKAVPNPASPGTSLAVPLSPEESAAIAAKIAAKNSAKVPQPSAVATPAKSSAASATASAALPIVAIAAGAGILWWLLKTKKKA